MESVRFSRFALWAILSSAFALVPSLLHAQTAGSGGGSTGNSATTITSIRTGTDTWTMPYWDGPDVKMRVTQHNWDVGTPGIGKWYVNGVETNSPPIPTGWWSFPPSTSGSLSISGSAKFTIQLPSDEHVNAVWVVVNSSVEIETDTPDLSATINVDNGLNDPATGSVIDQTSGGKHLRKVSIDENGTGHYTVSFSGSSSATGSSVLMQSNLGYGLGRDPRSIGIPSSFKVVNLSGTDNYFGYYNKYHGVRQEPDHEHDFYGCGGNFPVLDYPSVSATYAKASRVLIDPTYSDNVTVKASYLKGVEPNVKHNVYSVVQGQSVLISSTGGLTREVSSGASYGGASSGESVAWSASHNEKSSGGTINGVSGSTSGLTSTVDAAAVFRTENVLPAPAHSISAYTPQAPKSSGNLAAKFTFSSDGMVADAKIDYTYKLKFEPVSQIMSVNGLPPEKNSFQPLVPWHKDGDIVINTEMELENILAAGAFLLEVEALCMEAVPIGTLLSVVGAGMGESLHSSLISKSTISVSRSLGYFWILDLPDWQHLYPHMDDTDVAAHCNEWRCDVAPDYEISFFIADQYGEDGFMDRSMVKKEKELATEGSIPPGARYYHFRIASNGEGGPDQ